MDWKSVLYDYVHHKNQMEVEPLRAERSLSLFAESFIDGLENRARLLAEWHLERGIRPLKNETRLKIVQVTETGRDVQADIELTRSFEYELRHTVHTERRVERERVHLSRSAQRWKVHNAEPLAFEKRPGVLQPQPDPAFSEDLSLSAFVRSPSTPYINPSLFGQAFPAARRIAYNRSEVQRYADTWWNAANPNYIRFEVDCSNFVSQCLYAGGAPMNNTGRRDAGWWYRGKHGGRELWSYSWAVAHSLYRYLSTSRSGLRAVIVDSPMQLTIGDVISYDWDGNGNYQHSVIVAAMGADGMPLVNAHTTESYHRYWDYRDSYAWTHRTKYRFFHIPDEL